MQYKRAAYSTGVADALEAFGVRTASQMMRRMPEGKMHSGAERLARTLADLPNEEIAAERPTKRLERPTRWGNRTSVEGGNPVFNPSLGSYGGV